ncbi:MAG: hypothetical protein ABIN96_12830, partial [Rubrivivax sp.]
MNANVLLDQLLVLSGALQCAEGVAQEHLDDARLLLAASIVQQNPALLPLLPDASFPAVLIAAAQAGVARAATLTATGVRLRFVRQPYLAAATDPGLATRVAGPFIDGDGSLIELRFFESLAMRSLLLTFPFVAGREVLLRLPLDTAGDAALRSFTIPAGTVLIGARLLVPGATGFVALQVDGGTLDFGFPAHPVGDSGNLEILEANPWTLKLQPQAASAADGAGGDGNALALRLPTRLVVRSIGPASAEGPIAIEGFGTALNFDAPTGAPIAADSDIVFAYGGGSTTWAIEGQRSALLALRGECSVTTALWALPRTRLPPQEVGAAAHGGSIGVALKGSLSSLLEAGLGRLSGRDPVLLANAAGLELRCRQGDASARLALSQWGPARTDLDLGPVLKSLRYASRRDGAEVVSASGGRLRTRWDLPRDAAGAPFGCDAALDLWSLTVEAQGLRRLAVVGSATGVPTRNHGLVLQNAYLSVTPVRRLGLAGSGDTLQTLVSGFARLDFDVLLGEPMLPDPYAANWTMPGQLRASAGGLSASLRWAADAAPSLRMQLEHPIDFPQQPNAAAESDSRLGERFRAGLAAQPEFLNLLDLSTRDHHFGVALQSLAEQKPAIDDDNRLSVELRQVRLLMQPQVHWEPVQDIVSPVPGGVTLRSLTHGGTTLMGADSAERVALLPSTVGRQIVAAAGGAHNAAALFSLPFGLRAYVHIDRRLKLALGTRPVDTQLHEPQFDDGLRSAQQLRLRAVGTVGPRRLPDPGRTMPGALHQTLNLEGGGSVLPPDVVQMFAFDQQLPLHAVDLSGYGLSCFSHWRREPMKPQDDAVGVTQVQFDVMVGRTAYELIEVRSVLAPCQARVVRTVVLERRNSGRVQRFDSGWQAVDDGLFKPYVPFETGVLRGLLRIRRIREHPQLRELTLSDLSVWRPVLFDADAQIDDLIAGGAGGTLPALDHLGYIQIRPVGDIKQNNRPEPFVPPERLQAPRMQALFKAVGGTIGGAIDGRSRLGGTLEMHLHSLQAAFAPDDVGNAGFVVAAYGSPVLPRAGRWSVVRIDGATADISPVDVRAGMPVVQGSGARYRFVDPTQVHQTRPTAEHGLLITTDSSRVLFPRPTVGTAVGQRGLLRCAPPLMADPVALVHASGQFPRSAFVLQGKAEPLFEISDANDWRLRSPDFPFDVPAKDLATGAGWSVQRLFASGDGVLARSPFQLQIDSALVDTPLQMLQPPQQLVLQIPGFGDVNVLTMDGSFEALSNAAAGLGNPKIVFGPAFEELTSVLDSLNFFDQLPAGLVVHVDVDADAGPNPGFSVHLNLKFSIGGGPEGRIDIGVGKFYGEFELDAHFSTALGGKTGGRLKLVFQGDVQQGILPPVLYAGGLFRFAIEIGDSGKPVIELGLGTVTSIGGDLIGGLLALEATVKYGYLLVPQTLKPGVLLGIDARAQLLAGLFSMSFSADALARIE